MNPQYNFKERLSRAISRREILGSMTSGVASKRNREVSAISLEQYFKGRLSERNREVSSQ